MRKCKLYLDTSVISYLYQPDRGENFNFTWMFWDSLKSYKYDLFVSDAVLEEISKCSEEKANSLTSILLEKYIVVLPIDEETIELANLIIENGILPKKSFFDAKHIAAALIENCDYLVSWNMKHLANIETNNQIRKLTISEHYPELQIVPPIMLLKEELL
jgi:predicted nucleic acid-binding protein